MAPNHPIAATSHGHGAAGAHQGISGGAGSNGGPPPSTLAAQLVENIAAPSASAAAGGLGGSGAAAGAAGRSGALPLSSSSATPDETAELKRFFAQIERIKNQETPLKTPEERIGHNHMLIYVYARVVLDSLKWDDPFANRAHLQAEAAKAVSFLRVTIEETPEVLTCITDGRTFLFRSGEPLWVWVFPRILRLLGNPYCTPLVKDIELFFRQVFVSMMQSGSLWGEIPVFVQYLAEAVKAILDQIRQRPSNSRGKETLWHVDLPPQPFLDQVAGEVHGTGRLSYRISTIGYALRHATSVVSILLDSILLTRSVSCMTSVFRERMPWILDAVVQIQDLKGIADAVPLADVTAILQKCVACVSSVDEIMGGPALVQKGYLALVLLCRYIFMRRRGLVRRDAETAVQRRAVAATLIHLARASLQSKATASLVESHLSDLIAETVSENAIADDTDFVLCCQLLTDVALTLTPETPPRDKELPRLQDPELRRLAAQLVAPKEKAKPREGGNAKRQEAERPTGSSEISSRVLRRLRGLLRAGLHEPLETVFQLASEQFDSLSEAERCRLLSILADLCCAADSTLVVHHSTHGSTKTLSCSLCTPLRSAPTKANCVDAQLKKSTTALFSHLTCLPGFLESSAVRVFGMSVLRRLIIHTTDEELLDLETSTIAQWCLQSLQSSVRELRVAAGRTLPVFVKRWHVHDGADLPVFQRNRAIALAYLKSLSEKKSPQLDESCIMAWGQLGRIVPDDELNLTLVKLLEYLHHPNIMTSGFAFNELLNLAEDRGVTPRRLFEPFWSSLAFFSVKDLVSRPQTTQLIADLLQMSVEEFLLTVQTHALPWLVLTKRKEVVQKIAEARGEEDAWQPCWENVNLGAVLVLLLTQDAPDADEFAMSHLRYISPHFNHMSLADLLRAEPVMTALGLLKALGEADGAKKHRIRSALQLVATTLIPPNYESQGSRKKPNVIGRFIQQNVLGLMARLTDVINDPLGVSSTPQEQNRCIRAMEEMIKISKAYIRIARPQISACLLSVLDNDRLRTAAFSCWTTLLLYLEEEDVEVLAETTFHIISHYWRSFDEESRQKAVDTLQKLIETYGSYFERNIHKLPSLGHIEELAPVEALLQPFRKPLDNRTAFAIYAERLRHENSGVVLQALTELSRYLEKHQDFLQTSAISEQPDDVVTTLMRALLDCNAKYNGVDTEISRLCTECIGSVGCLDSNRLDATRVRRQFVVLTNFEDSEEMKDFVLFTLEEVLVDKFLSASSDTKLQGFLSFAMQELLDKCDFRAACLMQEANIPEAEETYKKWLRLPESVREVLTPFLNSKYKLAPMTWQKVSYPIFRPGRMMYGNWLRPFVTDLLHREQSPMANLIFRPLCRLIRVKDFSIGEFLLPYAVLHVIIGDQSTQADRDNVIGELRIVLEYQLPEDATSAQREDMKLCCEAVFRVLDYAMQWLHAKKAIPSQNHRDSPAIKRVQMLLDSIPAELISQKAMDCKAYSRALFHLEQHIRQVQEKNKDPKATSRLLEQLQDIYAQIDEPDGLDGIAAHLHVLDINHQMLSHRKAGRWTAAQTWYEIRLTEDPGNIDTRLDLLTCLKESGQHEALLNYVEGMNLHNEEITAINKIVPYAVEASWATARWETLGKYLNMYKGDVTENFNVAVGSALLWLMSDKEAFKTRIRDLRGAIAASMTYSTTMSLQTCHDLLLQCHVLSDLEIIAGPKGHPSDHQETLKALERRLEVLGSYVNDKQYLLSIRRAAMELMGDKFAKQDISALWLSSARLARKANSTHQSFNAVLHALELGDDLATIENARLLWKDGHHRKAIRILQGAIASNTLGTRVAGMDNPVSTRSSGASPQNIITARANLLLAKWLDNAGQTHALALRKQYQEAAKLHLQWEKGHYYLGRHYKKLLESEKGLKPEEQSDEYHTGEIAKLVIENYIRSLNYGTKYLYQTLPRILTLWLEMGAQIEKAPEGRGAASPELILKRKRELNELHKHLVKHIPRMPAYIFYTALPQIVARIAHPNVEVFNILQSIIIKVVEAHPHQAIWSLFPFMTTRQKSDRRERGLKIILHLKQITRRPDGSSFDMKSMLRMGEKLAEQLLMACNNGDFQSNRTTVASITRDLNFNHKCVPCPLVVPVEKCLHATLPTLTDNLKKHRAFSRDIVTIQSFLDEVLVLGSLAKPRRLQAVGSDGETYGLLIKPKDDLRTDQRLMEFNGMINRSLKRDAESSIRQLYIRTYAVVPLNEECGIIEWVEGLKTLREILLNLYKMRGIVINYSHIAQLMKEASSAPGNIKIFTEGVLGMFPPVLPTWFIQQYPNPSAWFAARLKYTRSCAVMSMVGTILGLGDRHGENVLLEEGNGGIFHVDFNCLFDKGLTFQLPERVPFRLTHNMVAAMGIYGYEGPFRRCSELTLSILRQQEETLMTILEAFIYDPTLDLQRDKRSSKKSADIPAVRLNPQSVVESIKRKVKGLLPDESIPLGVEGQVEELIKQAVDPVNLAAMYIGWCPFL